MAFLVGCTLAAPPTEEAPPLAPRVEALLDPLVATREFSGAVVLARGGDTVYQGGFGLADHSAAVPFTAETPVDGGSLAKTFTAAGLWWLAEEGELDLDTAVRRYVPVYPHGETTVRHLLSHSTGLDEDWDLYESHFGPGEIWTTPAMLQLEAPRPSFPPGSRYEYSNLGFDAAALVIERVSGQSYGEFVRGRFLSRLGLGSTFVRPARFADWPGIRTRGYRWRDGEWALNDASDGEGFVGGSNLYFTALDLARWGSAWAAGEALPEAVFEAGRRDLAVGGLPLTVNGLSWHCDAGDVRCSYTGHHAAFHSFVHWDLERDESVVFVSNSSLPAWTIATLQRNLVRLLAGRPLDEDEAVELVPLAEADVAGTYTAPGTELLILSAGPDGLRVQVGTGLEFGAYPAGEEVLYVPGLDYFLAFSHVSGAWRMHVKSQELNLVARRLTDRALPEERVGPQ